MKYMKDEEGFIIISLTPQEIEKYNRDTFKIWLKWAALALFAALAIFEMSAF